MILRFLFSILFTASAAFLSGQTVFDNCADAEADVGFNVLPSTPFTATFGALTLDAAYDPPSITSVGNGFLKVTVSTTGVFDIQITAANTTATGDVSLAWGDDCASLTELSSGDVAAWTGTCVNVTAGDEYIFAVAFAGVSGDIEFDFVPATPPSNDDCAGAIALSGGNNTGLDNLCSADGEVWYSYTVLNGSDMDFTVAGLSLASATITQAYLNSCAGVDILNAWDCLSPGDQVFFAVGDISPAYGDFDIDIVDNASPSANDDCFTSMGITLLCGPGTITFTGVAGSCYDVEAESGGCIPINLASAGGIPEDATGGVWNSFTIDPSLPLATVSGSLFEVFIGPDCNSLTSLGCSMTELDPAVDGSNNYHVLVFEGGSFTATPLASPGNDLCAALTGLTIGNAPLDGTLVCAAQDITGTGCDEEAQVFYTFTSNATDKTDITITITGGTGITGAAADEASFVVLEDCAGTLYNDANAVQCDILTGASQALTCVEPLTTLIIMVQSSFADAGDFQIEITESTPLSTPANDLCAGAIDASSGSAAGTTECANSEDPYCGGTDTDNDYQTVYYTYTVASTSANLTITVAGSGSPALSAGSIAFYDACATDLGDEYGAPGDLGFGGFTCDHTTGLDLFCVPAGTYTIAVGSSLAGEGSFDLTITEADATVPNDLCVNATPISNGGLTNQTNLCAEGELAYCSLDGTTSHDVYYSFDPMGTPVDITITVSGGGMAPSIGEINLLVLDACGGTVIDPTSPADGCNLTDIDIVYNCVDIPIIIVVGSPDGLEGNFDIDLNTADATPTNDACAAADGLLNGDVFASDNLCSGPDHNQCGGGGPLQRDNSTVYFDYTTGATNVDLTITVSGGATPISDASVVVFEDDCATTYNDPDALQCSYVLGSDIILECVPANTQIFIAVGSTDDGEGDFDIIVTETNAAPDNDECATSAEVLVDGTAFDGTTACSSPDPVGYCGLNTTDDGVVYHEYTVTGTDNVELTISVSTSTSTTGTAIANAVLNILEDDCSGQNYTTVNPQTMGDPCAALNGDIVFTCVEPGTVIVIAVGAPAVDAGDYTITVSQDNSVVAPDGNDLCVDALPINIVNDCEFQTINGDDTNACPEDFAGSSCDFDGEGVVWYSVTLPSDGTGIEFVNLSADLFVGIFEDNCAALALAGNPGDCSTGDQIYDGLVGGSTYLIGVGTQGGGSGPFSFDIKTIVPPANDICDPDAEILASNTATPGTNVCATGPITGTACDPDKVSTVWYSYTVEPDVKEIIIDVTSWTTSGADQISVAAVDGCATLGLLTQADNTAADYCGGSGTDLLTFTCLDEGDEIFILVSSSVDNEGSFDITVNTTLADPACVDNDFCADADATAFAPEIITDDPEVCVTDCNTLACPDDEIDALCGGTVFNAVFFEVTTDNFDPTVPTFIQASVTGLTSPVVMVLEGSCAAYTLLPGSVCAAGDTGPLDGGMTLAPNTTYTIVVGTTDNMGGTFDLCVRVFSGCVNDECADAVEVTGVTVGVGTTITNPASTVACMPDVACGDNDQSTVWYRFTMPDGATSFDVDITGIDIGGTSIQIGEYDPAACPNPAAEVQECNATTATFDCAVPGVEYFILIGSNNMMDEGAFELTITPNPPTVANDLCTGAEVVVVDLFCDWMEFAGTTVDACPEQGTADGCDYSISPVTWYQFTTPPDPISNVSMEVTGALAAPFFGIFTDCGPPLTFISGFGCNTAQTDNIPLTANTTYFIAVGSTVADAEDIFNLRIRIDVPPDNDSPDVNHPFTPPIDLTGGGGHSGTTCCALGANDDPAQDIANQECSGALDDDSVWYTFTPDGVSQGVRVTVTPGAVSQGSVEVYEGAPNGMILGSDCGFNEPIEIGCAKELTPPLFIKVTSTEAGCGTFSILVEDIEPDCGPYADECVDAPVEALETNLDGVITLDVCQKSCLDLACPSTNVGGCGEPNGPTVWFQFDIDDDAAQVYIGVVPDDGSWDPLYGIYAGPDCDNLTLINGCNPAQLHQAAVQTFTVAAGGNGSVWVAVTAADPSTIIDPAFTICASATVQIVACVGGDPPNYEPNCDPDATFEVIERSADPDGTLGLPVEGPYCPGEVIRVCTDFFYDASITGQDWLHGIVPIVGNGFDMVNFDPTTVSHAGTGGVPEWFPQNTTRIQKDIPNTCVYTDADGVVRVCNKFCDVCPCFTPMPMNTFLPGGWFWNSPGGNAGCDGGTSLPETSWGIGVNTVQITDFCFDLQIRDFADLAECNAATFEVGFQTFSDAASGCWDDFMGECLNDVSQVDRELVMVACEFPPEVWPTPLPREICSGEMVNIFVETSNGASLDIVITPVDNPNVNGETLPVFTFTGGAGTITDVLTVLPGITTPQIVEYTARAVVQGQICPGPDTTFEVTVYPDLDITFNPNPVLICPGGSTTLLPIVLGGTGNYGTYNWAPTTTLDDPASPTPTATPLTQTTYTVTVTDDLGCTGTGQVTVEVTDPVELEIFPDSYVICQNPDGINDGINITVDVLLGTPPFTFVWLEGFGIVGNNTTTFVDYDGDTYSVDEENSFLTGGVPSPLEVQVTDANGCSTTIEVEVEIVDAPIPDIAIPNFTCGETQITLEGSGLPGSSGSTIFTTSIWTCDGIQIADAGGDFVSIDINLLDYTPPCFYVLVEDEDGCTARTADFPLTITLATPVELSGDDMLCDGDVGSITVDNQSDYTEFVWAPGGETTATISTIPTETTYTVTATDAAGCEAVEQWIVTYLPNPDAQISGSATYCLGTSTTLSGGGDPSMDTYSWTGPITGAGQTLVVSSPGEYILSLTNSDGCSDTDTINVVERDTLEPIISGGPICDGSSVVLTAAGFETYEWFAPDGTATGITNDSITVDSAGVYRVSVTNAGCAGSGTFTVVENTAPMVDAQDTVFVCAIAGEDQTLDFTTLVTGDLGVWSFVGVGGPALGDVTNVDFAGLALGTYRFVYRDTVAMAPCPTARDTMRVILVRPSAATFVPQPLCNDQGTLVLSTLQNTTSPGTWAVTSGPLGHTLDASTGTITAAGQPAGSYVLTFTVDPIPGVDCQPTSMQTLEIIEAPVIIPTGVNNQACDAATGGNVTTFDISTLVDPASAAGTWTQTGGPAIALVGTVIDVAGVAPGTIYSFTYSVDNVEPCRDIDQVFTVEVINCQCPPAQLMMLPRLCSDQAAIDLDDFLTGSRVGTWSTDATPDPLTGSSFDPSGLSSGSYEIFYVFDTPIQDCPDSLQQTIIIRAAPSITFNPFDQPCNENTGVGPTTVNLAAIVSGNGTSGGVWTQVPNGSTTLTITGGIVDFDGELPGTEFVFEYTTTSENANSPCSNISDQITIIVSNCQCEDPTINGDAVCNDEGIYDLAQLLTATTDPGSFGVLSPAMATVAVVGTTVDLTGLAGGDYIVTYTLTNIQGGNCPQLDTAILAVSAIRAAVMVPEIIACTVQDAEFSPLVNLANFVQSGDTGGYWLDSNGDSVLQPGLQNFVDRPNGQTFEYTYVLPGAAPCDTVRYTVVVRTVDCDCPLIAPLPIPDVCSSDGSIDLSAYDDPAQAGMWSSDVVTISTTGVADLSGLAAGDYDVYYTIDSPEPDCPPADTVQLTIVVPDNAGVPAAPANICQDVPETITLVDLLDGEDSGGMWIETSSTSSTGSGFNPATGTFNTTGQAVGTYTFDYSFSGNDPCPDVSETVVVVIEPVPIAIAGPDAILTCDLTEVTLGGASSTGPDVVYAWTLAGTTVGTQANYLATQEGMYTLVVTNTATGCTSSDEVQVDLDGDLPQVSVTVEQISCFGVADGRLVISVTGGASPLQYSIDGGVTTSSSGTFGGLTPGSYAIQVTDAQGCVVNQAATIDVKQEVTVDAGPDLALERDKDTTLTFSTSVLPENLANIEWTQDGVVICQGVENCTQVTVTGDFQTAEFCVTVTDSDGCTGEDCMRIVTETVINLNIPSIFSPNGDRTNESFYVKSSSVSRVNKMLIYNRWGELVFEVRDVAPNDPAVGWTGLHKGKAVNPGVFVYAIEVSYVNDAKQPETITGDITVLR